MALLDLSAVSQVTISQRVGSAQKIGTPTSVTVTDIDSAANVTACKGTTVPSDGDTGFAKGCKFVKTNGSVATTVYYNEGDETSADFNAVESSASSITGVTADLGLMGTATSGTATISRGFAVRNQTGSTIVKGSLVRISGYASSLPLIVLADADTAGARATFVTTADIATASNGTVYGVALVTGINTDAAAAVGDPIYLSSTAGAFTATAPTGADQIVQRVGIVTVKNATTGEAIFFPEYNIVEKLGTSGLQLQAVSRANATNALQRKSESKNSPTIATTSTTDVYMIVAETGTLDSVDFSGVDALAASDTNYVSFSIVNLGANGSGTAVMLDAGAVNSTRVTGGSALAAGTKRTLSLTSTPADLNVNAGDRLRIRATVTGTLANTVTFPVYCLRFAGTT